MPAVEKFGFSGLDQPGDVERLANSAMFGAMFLLATRTGRAALVSGGGHHDE